MILFDYKASNLLGEFGISLNENFIQSNQNVRGAGSAPRIQWTLSGLVLIRGGAFEGSPRLIRDTPRTPSSI